MRRADKLLMVRLARFERATYCLGGSCSILLSYNRTALAVYHGENFFARRVCNFVARHKLCVIISCEGGDFMEALHGVINDINSFLWTYIIIIALIGSDIIYTLRTKF